MSQERAIQHVMAKVAADVGKPEKLGKDVLEEFMKLFAGMAAYYQPRPKSLGENPNADHVLFFKYSELAVYAARELAKYQSPTFRAVVIAAPPPPRQDGTKRFTLAIFDSLGHETLIVQGGGGAGGGNGSAPPPDSQ